MNIWIIGKNSKRHHYLKKKIFTVTKLWKILSMQIMRTQKEFGIFEIKALGEYHDLYVQSDMLLLADVFKNKICVFKYMKLNLLVFLLHEH